MSRTGYRRRLRLEGGVLAVCGLVGSVVLAGFVAGARANVTSTLAQLGAVLALLAVLAPLGAVRAMRAAHPITREQAGDGEPTPLWQLPAIVVALTLALGFPAGWDAGLRVTGGCVLVGLAQAVLIERMVASRERAGGSIFIRLPGSRILRGTRLGRVGAGPRCSEASSGPGDSRQRGPGGAAGPG